MLSPELPSLAALRVGPQPPAAPPVPPAPSVTPTAAPGVAAPDVPIDEAVLLKWVKAGYIRLFFYQVTDDLARCALRFIIPWAANAGRAGAPTYTQEELDTLAPRQVMPWPSGPDWGAVRTMIKQPPLSFGSFSRPDDVGKRLLGDERARQSWYATLPVAAPRTPGTLWYKLSEAEKEWNSTYGPAARAEAARLAREAAEQRRAMAEQRRAEAAAAEEARKRRREESERQAAEQRAAQQRRDAQRAADAERARRLRADAQAASDADRDWYRRTFGVDLDVAVADAAAAMEATAVERELNPNLHRDPVESRARHVPLQHLEMARVKQLIEGTLDAMMARIVQEYDNRGLDSVRDALHTQIICKTNLEIIEGVAVRLSARTTPSAALAAIKARNNHPRAAIVWSMLFASQSVERDVVQAALESAGYAEQGGDSQIQIRNDNTLHAALDALWENLSDVRKAGVRNAPAAQGAAPQLVVVARPAPTRRREARSDEDEEDEDEEDEDEEDEDEEMGEEEDEASASGSDEESASSSGESESESESGSDEESATSSGDSDTESEEGELSPRTPPRTRQRTLANSA